MNPFDASIVLVLWLASLVVRMALLTLAWSWFIVERFGVRELTMWDAAAIIFVAGIAAPNSGGVSSNRHD